VLYAGYYLLGYGPTSAEMYEQQMAELRAMRPEPEPQEEAGSLAALVSDQQALNDGEQIFQQNCAACHGPNGEGGIGPNLTDDYWIHGNTAEQILATVREGVLDKGMPAWKSSLNPEQIQHVVAYAVTLHGTEPSGAKDPQGEEMGAPEL